MRTKFNIALFWVGHAAFLFLADFDWQWVVAGVVWAWIVFVFGLQIGAHRYFAHTSFETSKPWARAMNFMAILGGMGTPQDWMVAHIAHHKYSDTEKDPTNLKLIGLWKNYSSLWQLNVPLIQPSLRLVSRSLKDPVARFIQNNCPLILAAWGAMLALVSVQALVWLFFLPLMVGHWGMNLLNHIGHLGGPHGRATSTSLLFNLVTPGDGYHDFHHQNPRAYRYGKYDLLAWLIDRIKTEGRGK